jgi:hypothetical protein
MESVGFEKMVGIRAQGLCQAEAAIQPLKNFIK